MERAYLERDAAYNGLFFLGVRTTGIFCRPTCPARKPLPTNVEYFASTQAAERAGYRPCKRCRPLEVDDQPAWVADLLAELDRDPATRITDGDLKAKGIDPATVRRYFRRCYGMTFQAFTRARRLSETLMEMQETGSLDTAAAASGYESESGFRAAFARTFGATPRRASKRDCVLLSWIRTPLGPIVAGGIAEGICLLEFTDREMLAGQIRAVEKLFAAPVVPGTNDHLKLLATELASYFSQTLRTFSVPLVYPGTAFQRRVWEQLRAIPYGETRSYEQIAHAVGDAKAVRAVGRANGLNRIAIVIPCHRVINKSGQLGGYAGGLRRKEFLLALERGDNALGPAGQALK
ncbi:MAG: methylated-DNA--[protein]-cysteine S-methyltransferase [Planctomycetes bacterium]|nr:methylated-DNA--[protein]-cysteine S-methyltransferase [Planctomycetota bacterium]